LLRSPGKFAGPGPRPLKKVGIIRDDGGNQQLRTGNWWEINDLHKVFGGKTNGLRKSAAWIPRDGGGRDGAGLAKLAAWQHFHASIFLQHFLPSQAPKRFLFPIIPLFDAMAT
jgi:hypothetical protein